jgi:methionine sulfoxide reductase heme-binding subunit
MHVYAWVALAHLLIFRAALGNLSVNPIQDLEQRTGRHAITLLVLSLAVHAAQHALRLERTAQTPPRARSVRLHVCDHPRADLLDLDYGLAWSSDHPDVLEKPVSSWGLITFLMLIPLAVTSFDIWKKRLGKNWKRLHQTSI